MASRIAIGVDVGGSGIKAAAVDLDTGAFASDRVRVPTPSPSTPEAVIDTIAQLIEHAHADPDVPRDAPLGVGIPTVVLEGVSRLASNIDKAWIDFPVAEAMTKALGRPVAVLNDADAAGLAEMRFGVGQGLTGTVLVLTLGTGVGSALFIDGRLVPNTEFGQMEIRGKPAEKRSAAGIRTKRKLSWKKWAVDLDEHLDRIDQLVWPSIVILGGGVSKRADKFVPFLTSRVPVTPAELRNDAGIVGAALAAAEGFAAAATETTGTAAAGPANDSADGASGPDGHVPADEAAPSSGVSA
jgi:polyphosphate glucokinase